MRNMGYLQDIMEVEERAKALNLSVSGLCRRAGVKYSMWWKWRKEMSSPTMRTFSVTMSKMRTALEAEENRVRAVLNGEAA